jgi:hypothetical protein
MAKKHFIERMKELFGDCDKYDDRMTKGDIDKLLDIVFLDEPYRMHYGPWNESEAKRILMEMRFAEELKELFGE